MIGGRQEGVASPRTRERENKMALTSLRERNRQKCEIEKRNFDSGGGHVEGCQNLMMLWASRLVSSSMSI